MLVFNPTSTVPALGASGAIAGVLGCYMRLFPLARVIVLVPILFIPLFFEVPAFVFVGLWFLIQIFRAPLELCCRRASGGVAWWAHVGGFVAGSCLARCWYSPTRRYREYYPRRRHSRLRHGRTRLITHAIGGSMSFGDLFWLFFMFSALQPVLRQRMLEAMRMRKIAQLESERKSRVILLVHRQETMRLLGFPLARYIDINDSEEVLRAIQMTDDDVPLDIVLHTPGGLVLAALQIARAVREHKAKVTVFVPHYAMSGGTLIALAADEIVMCEHSVLGPIDPQLGQSPAASLIKVVEQKPIARIDDQTLSWPTSDARRSRRSRRPRATSCSGGCPPSRRARWRRSSRPAHGRTTIRSGRRQRVHWACR